MLKRFAILVAPLLAVAVFAAEENLAPASAAGAGSSPGSAIALTAVDGKLQQPLADRGQKATVLVFLMHDCPVTNATAPELARLAGEFTAQGVQFFRIYATETAEEVTTHGTEYGLTFAGLLDPDLQLARFAGATRAPEAAVISPDGTLLYRGRIDDRAVKSGTMRPTAARHDLRVAIESVLAGHKPEPRFTTAVGCYLPSK